MPAILESLPFMAAAVLVVSAVYGFWMWTRFRAGRVDALFSSGLIIGFQLLSVPHSDNVPLALVAAIYHAALVGAVFTFTRGYIRSKANANPTVR
jgi:hypothetical protein